jgi:hypothetical protein
MKNPYLVAIPAFLLMIVAWGQALALGLPYRWRNMPPGLCVVRCSECGTEIPEGMHCGKCGSFRPGHLVMKSIWAVNVCITTLWVTHDAMVLFLGFSRGK